MAEETKTSKVPEIVATSLAGLTSAYLGSFFGVTGTMMGLAFGSMISGLATEVYKHYFAKAHDSLKNQLIKKKGTIPSSRDIRVTERRADGYAAYFQGVLVEPPKNPQWTWKKLNWKWATAIAIMTFVVGFGSISLIEMAKGSPLSGGNSGTTISGLLGNPTQTKPTKVRPTRTETITETPWSTTKAPIETTTTSTAATTTTPVPKSSQSFSETTTSPPSSVAPTTTTESAVPQVQTIPTK